MGEVPLYGNGEEVHKSKLRPEREFFIGNLLVRILFIIVMISSVSS